MDSDRPPWMPPLEESKTKPAWDQDDADWLIGKYVLAGITWMAADGQTVTDQSQYHGRVVAVSEKDGVRIACEGQRAGEFMTLPPDLRAFQLADPGEYRLRSTGEVVTNPDVVTSWTMTRSDPMES